MLAPPRGEPTGYLGIRAVNGTATKTENRMATVVKKTRPAPWTQMKRGLKPRARPEKTKRRRIKPVSKSRARVLALYARKAKRFRAEHPWCGRCNLRATDVHHKRGRVGSLLTDERHWVTLCRSCHDWVGANPGQAAEAGWLDLGKWGQP